MRYLILLVLLVSCIGPIGHIKYTRIYTRIEAGIINKVIPVFIDNNFGEDDKISIDNAISTWNYCLNGNITLQVYDLGFKIGIEDIDYIKKKGGLLVMKVDSKYEKIPKSKKGKMNIGWADLESRSIIYLIRDRIDSQEIFGIMLHEVGHILGGVHKVGENLMNPTYSKENYQCIDYETIKQVAKFNRLDIGKLNYCILKD